MSSKIQNALRTVLSSYIIFVVKFVPECSFMLKQLMYDTLMLGNECVQSI